MQILTFSNQSLVESLVQSYLKLGSFFSLDHHAEEMIDNDNEKEDDFELVNKRKGKKFHKKGRVRKTLLPYSSTNYTYFHTHCSTSSSTLTDV